jgi:NTE family protein
MPAGSQTSPKDRAALAERLANVAVFRSLPASLLDDLVNEGESLTLHGGELLFEQDAPSDALFVLLAGRLLARRRQADGRNASVGLIAAGECVGEAGLIANAPRNASVYALRDSELLRLPRAAFERLLTRHPQAMLDLTRTALRRYAQMVHRPPRPQCFALLPAHEGLPLREFAEAMVAQLSAHGACAIIGAEEGRGRSPAFFSEREASLANLILLGDFDPDWRNQCVRQSDCVLLLADTLQAPFNPALPTAVGLRNRHVVLFHHGRVQRGHAAAWREAWPELGTVHHARALSDVGRIVRLVSGRALSLVLSGGGARGFAHMGVIRALRESGVEIDCVSGTSIGAIIAAGLAADWPHQRLLQALRHSFVRQRPISDWTLPLVALTRGRRASYLLREAFGERSIEDLVRPYFCVSADLTSGELAVHDSGPLWLALRASSSIPGLLPPVFSQQRILVDGGVIDNLPVGEMRRRHRGACIAVDVSSGFPPKSELEEHHLPGWWQLLGEHFGKRRRPSIGQLLLRAGMINSDVARRRRQQQAACLLQPPLTGIELLGWKQFDAAEAIGYRYAMQRMEELQVAVAAALESDA